MKDALSFDINSKSIIKFAGPSIILMLFTSLYLMIDGAFVSNYVGSKALSALNIVWPAYSFLMSVGIMFGTGGGAICAIKLGQNNYKDAKIAFSTIITFAVLLTFILMLILIYFIKPIIYSLGATEEIYHYAKDYLLICTLFSPLLVIQILLQFFLFTAGKPNKAFMLTLIGGLTNIFFDYIFIVVFDYKTAGAALATGLGELFAATYGVCCFLYIKKLSLRFVKPKFLPKTILNALVNGSSEMVNTIAGAIIIYLFNKNMMALAGVDGVAAITIILYIEFLIISAYIGYANGVAPLLSFNYGEGNNKKLRALFIRSRNFISIAAIISVIFTISCADFMVSIFQKRDTQIFELATTGLRLFTISFVFIGFNLFASGLFTAFSNGKISALISFLRTLVFITGFLIILPKYWGLMGVWLAVPIAEVITFIISTTLLLKYKKVYKY